MDDDWSLKERLRQCSSVEHSNIFGRPIRHYYYSPIDILTLRQKLIEDLRRRFITKDGKDVTLGGYEYMVKIINKRFGVEE